MNHMNFLTFPITLRQLDGTRRPDQRRRFGRRSNDGSNTNFAQESRAGSG